MASGLVSKENEGRLAPYDCFTLIAVPFSCHTVTGAGGQAGFPALTLRSSGLRLAVILDPFNLATCATRATWAKVVLFYAVETKSHDNLP